MVKCDQCRREFGSGSALARHKTRTHKPPWGPNRKALEETLKELQRQERLGRLHAARIQAARSLADAVDQDKTNAYLWRTYREALDALIGDEDGSPDAFEKLLAEINSRAALGNPPTS